ncbi:MAG: acetyltransferase [Rhodospirillaceae bacterium]|nr:MAG: acetyltransferase [Rhodospirillaceae bacterium]
MSKLILFGTGQIAELASFYFEHDTDHDVVAFTVDGQFAKEPNFQGKPVIAFEEIEKSYDPDKYAMFVAVSYSGLNRVRTEKVEAAKAKGYRLATYVSSRATIFAGFEPKENCFILEDNTIQPFAQIGRNVTLWSGNHIGHHSVIEDNCFIASHVVISGGVRIGDSSFIGVNATFRDHVSIGRKCVIGAGALVLGNLDDESVVAARADEKASIPSSRLRSI